ncbi:MAG: hypothetical protein LBT97_03020 [Planctomycetota bacterium]|nr:hypothetical protein [Planctomycetota bacterium]
MSKAVNATTTDDYRDAVASGKSANARSDGDFSTAVAIGSRGSIAISNGNYSHAVCVGEGDRAGSAFTVSVMGAGSHAVGIGDHHHIMANGNGHAVAVGDCGLVSATEAAAVAIGAGGCATAYGADGMAVALGYNSRARGMLGSWLVVAEFVHDYEAEKDRDDPVLHLVAIKAAKIDGVNIQPDVYYRLVDGEFVLAQNE